MTDILASLNPSQRQAAETTEGPLLVLAGAGSGKTRVLTYRIANLITKGISGRNILAVTFTNKAAGEMRERIETLLNDLNKSPLGSSDLGRDLEGGKNPTNFSLPTVGTFHSICMRLLRREIENMHERFDRNFVIFDPQDAQSLVKMIMKERAIDEKEVKVRAILSHISDAKNKLITPSQYIQDTEDNRFTQYVKQIYPIYQKKLQEHNALDFDDLLMKVVELFEKFPQVLEKYQEFWKYILVDEYQDTNFAQYRIIRLLSQKYENLCVVGDDHQSIYAFRGADFRNILDFEKDFPNANVVKLEQNYRSSKYILANANHLIGKNRTGREKNLWTENDAGEKLKIYTAPNEKLEGQFIAEKIIEQKKLGKKYADFAILYRMNALSRNLEEALMRHQIPYQIVGGTRFFDRKEIKDVIAYLRLIFNKRDDVSFQRIINTPARKIGPATIKLLQEYAQNYTLSLFEVLEGIDEIAGIPETKKKILGEFFDHINSLNREAQGGAAISVILDKLIKKIKFIEFLDDKTPEGEARVQNVKELFSVAGRYDGADEPLAAFLEGVSLISDLDQMENQDAVTLMTIHASKGLEFSTVFLPGWEENIFPSSSSMQDQFQLEEERRLGYVAITRAEKECFISHAEQRMLFGRTNFSNPSLFLEELDPDSHENLAGSFSVSRSSRHSSLREGGVGGGAISNRGKNFSAKDYFSQPQPKTKKEAIFGAQENTTEYKISDRIYHQVYGEGTIILVRGDVLSVAFPGKGVQKIVASSSPISKV